MKKTFYAYAKINLFLDVTGKRSDGYHNIRSLMQTVSLCDQITLTVSDAPIKVSKECMPIMLSCDNPKIPTDEKNLAFRAAMAFYDAVESARETHIFIEKHIPMAAGLAGGSADAAAVFRGLNQMCGYPLSTEELCSIGKKLGADIPFCIVGGTAEVSGIGEQLRKLPDFPQIPMVVVKRGEGISTPQAYRSLDNLYRDFTGEFNGGTTSIDGYQALLDAIQSNFVESIVQNTYNVFESVVLPIHSDARDLKCFLKEKGALNALMSGSGPAVVAFFETYEAACIVADELNQGLQESIAFAVYPVPTMRSE